MYIVGSSVSMEGFLDVFATFIPDELECPLIRFSQSNHQMICADHNM